MNVLGVVNPMRSQKSLKRSRERNKGIKVVYISSPMKVKTSASQFRALVQELTGRDSDAERFMEINGAGNDHYPEDHQIMMMKSSSTSRSLININEDQNHQVSHDNDDHDQFIPFSFNSVFGDYPTSSSDDSSFIQLPTFGNYDQSIFG